MPTPRRSRAAMSADTTERLIAVARRQFTEKGFSAARPRRLRLAVAGSGMTAM